MTTETEIIKTVKHNSKEIEDVVNIVVDKFCKEFDIYIDEVREKIEKKDYTIYDLNEIILRIPLLLYRLGDGRELVGIREDVSRIVKEEAFNKIYLESEGTAQAKKSQAELQTQIEELYRIAYNRAYRIIQHKADAGTRLLDSAKKIITANMVTER
jgi:hypothetical protein